MAAHRRALRVVDRLLSAVDPLALALTRVCVAVFAHAAGEAATYDRPRRLGWFATQRHDEIRIYPDGDESEREIGRAMGIIWPGKLTWPILVLAAVLAAIPTQPAAWAIPIFLVAAVMLRVLSTHDRIEIEVAEP